MEKCLYPGLDEVEQIKDSVSKKVMPKEPDFVAEKPNYAKFKEWPADKVLVWLNVD